MLCWLQNKASRTRNQRTKLRTHVETLLLTNYGLKWNMAQGLAPGQVYVTINEAFKRHLDELEQMPASPMQRAASLVRAVLDEKRPGDSREGQVFAVV